MKYFVTFSAALALATATLSAQNSPTPSPEPAPAPAPAEPNTPPAPPAPAEPAPAPTPAETPVKAKHEPPKALDQKGKIESIDVENRTFAVEGKSFVLSKKGKVFVDGTVMSLSDVKVGDLVAVVYFAKADGTNTATRIIKGHKGRLKKSAAKKEKEAEAKD